MITPREILLARHQAVAPKLDAIRREVVAKLNNEETKEQRFSAPFVAGWFRGSQVLWRELVFPSRRIWTGLAAVWLLIFAVNFSQRDAVSSVTGKPVRSQAVMMSWQVQQRWMNELLADRAMPTEAEQPKTFSPKPRTEETEMMAA